MGSIHQLARVRAFTNMSEQGAMRFNTGKVPLSMVLEARNALEGCASVLAFGAKKYARGNWHKGLYHTQIVDSMSRHLSAYLAGEDIDPESGLRHVDHVLCNALFLSEGTITHPELDDRSEELKNAYIPESIYDDIFVGDAIPDGEG